MEVTKVFRKHSDLLKIIKAYETLFDVKPKMVFKGYAMRNGLSTVYANHTEFYNGYEIECVTSKYIYLKGDYDMHNVPFLIDENEHNFVTLSR